MQFLHDAIGVILCGHRLNRSQILRAKPIQRLLEICRRARENECQLGTGLLDQGFNLREERVDHLRRSVRLVGVSVRHEEIAPDLGHRLDAHQVTAVEGFAHRDQVGEHALRCVGQEHCWRQQGLRRLDQGVGLLQYFAVGHFVAVGNAIPAVESFVS